METQRMTDYVTDRESLRYRGTVGGRTTGRDLNGSLGET